jgi:phage terminase small subunit
MEEQIQREDITWKVTLTTKQKSFIDLLVKDNKPFKWSIRKYCNTIAMEAGFSPQAIDVLRKKSQIWYTAKRLIENRPVDITISDASIRNRNLRAEEKWSDRIEFFCREYVSDPYRNARAAAERAGYSGIYGWKLIQMPRVKDRILELQKERAERLKVDADDALQKLILLTNTNMADFIKRFDGSSIVFKDSAKLERDYLYSIKKIKQTIRGVGRNQTEEINIELESKLKPVELLLRHLGLLEKGGNVDPLEFAAQVREIAQAVNSKVPGGEI